jgi:hypothetical protein
MVEGEILIRENKLDAGIAALREAIKLEDALHYDEPPGWLIPVRHSLGAVLMKQQRFAEAEQVYRDDLVRSPENGWSLRTHRKFARPKEKQRGSKSHERSQQADCTRQSILAWRCLHLICRRAG